MKNSTKGFNFWFNMFILVGMIVAVCIVNWFKLQEPDVVAIKQIIIAVGAVMGVVNTVLVANGNIWTFLFGVIDVCICSYANYDSGNMGQFLQHVLYFLPMQFVGLWQWRKRGAGVKVNEDGSKETVKVRARRLCPKHWGYVIVGFVFGTAIAYGILYWIDMSQFNAGRIAEVDKAKLLLDASVVVLNIIGQILLSLAYADQWFIWNMVNVFSIMLWTNRLTADASSYTVVMIVKYSFYLLNSINGLRIWLKLSKEGSSELPEKAGCC
ncbi:nicotinamide mononucleotide transporter [Bacteroidales bacterium WCE2008]|nr:nicotinamide mononucleotide transporter [Bacteroidales bacterium WCE2008]